MIFTGLLSAVSILVIFAKLNPSLLKKMLGYEVHMDVLSHVFFVGLGALSATFSGLVTGLISALMVSAVLRLAKNFFGYSKRENGQWTEHGPVWTVKSITSKLYIFFTTSYKNLATEVEEGIREAQGLRDSHLRVVK